MESFQGFDEGHLKHFSHFTFSYIGQKWDSTKAWKIT